MSNHSRARHGSTSSTRSGRSYKSGSSGSRSSSRSSRSGSGESQRSQLSSLKYKNGGAGSHDSYSSSQYSRTINGGVGRNAASDKSNRMAKRVLSAGRLKVNELRNQVAELNTRVIELREENKLMKRQHIRQEKKLGHYESLENDMPTLLQRQNAEMNMLREQLRRQKEKLASKEKKLHKTEEDLERSSRLLKKMKGLVDDKKLVEREELTNKLEKCEKELNDKNEHIKKLERHIENLNKNHKHEFGIEHARQKEASRNAEQLKTEIERLQSILREREKESNVKGMYAPQRLSGGVTGSSSSTGLVQKSQGQGDSLSPSGPQSAGTESQTSGSGGTGKPRNKRLMQRQNELPQSMKPGGTKISDQDLLQASPQKLKYPKPPIAGKTISRANPTETSLVDDKKPPLKSISADKVNQSGVKENKRQSHDSSIKTSLKNMEEDSAVGYIDSDAPIEEELDEIREQHSGQGEMMNNMRLKEELVVDKSAERHNIEIEDAEQRREKDNLLEKLNHTTNMSNELEVNKNRRAGRAGEQGFGGYMPSFLDGASSSDTPSSQNIMEELFGSEDKKKQIEPQQPDDFGFLEPGKPKKSLLPRRKREPAATLGKLPSSGNDEFL